MTKTPRLATAAVAVVVVGAVVVNGTSDNNALATACYLGVLVGASVWAWIGAERAPRERRLVPRLIATGITLSALGDLLWSVLDLMGADTDVSIADPLWLTSYVVLCAALGVVLARSQGTDLDGRRIDVLSLIDAATVVVVSVLIFWSFSVSGIVADQSLPPLVRAVWASYPIADAVMLALVARALLNHAARSAIGPLFAAGVCLWLAADLAYLKAPEVGVPGAMMDAAWMIAPVLMAGAAWQHEGIARPSIHSAPRGGSVGQLIVAVGPLFLPPALELAADLRGRPEQPLQLFLGTTALVTLAFLRTARLIRSEERAQRKLEAARDTALNASHAKSMFLANMSHEIRTPLTTVLAAAELLEDTRLDEVQLTLVEKMSRSGESLKSLVDGILDFSRIEAGQLKLSSTPFDLHALMVDATDAYAPRATRAGLRFDCVVHPRVPRLVVGDRDRLFQVLTNLLDNALKFTHRGQVSLDVRPATSIEDAGGTDVVEFIVADSGIGIAEELQPKVFESFYQVDGSTTRSYGGNGLGLAICQDLVELMGGSITLESQVGAGSTFVVRIPLRRDQARQDLPMLHAVS